MADNSTLPVSVGTEVFANDDIGGVKYPRVKVTWGPDATANDTDVASGKPMPVQMRVSDGTAWTYGAGAVAAGTPRFTHASDDPLVAGNITAGATSIADNEDAASADGDRGIKVLFKRKDTPAASSGTDGDYEQPQMSGGFLWVASPPVVKVSTNFNRPADTTAYAANDAVADNTTAGSVTKLSWSIPRAAGIIRRVRIRKSDQTVATPTIRLWLWDATFTVGAGDNAAFTGPLQDTLGFVDVAVTSAGSDDAVGWNNCDIPFSVGTVFGLLQTLSAFTPANAETFTIDLWYLPS